LSIDRLIMDQDDCILIRIGYVNDIPYVMIRNGPPNHVTLSFSKAQELYSYENGEPLDIKKIEEMKVMDKGVKVIRKDSE